MRLWGAIAAGAARMPWPAFMLWNVLGSIAWVTSLAVLAFVAGNIARRIADYLDIGGWILLPVAIAGTLLWLRHRRITRFREAEESNAH